MDVFQPIAKGCLAKLEGHAQIVSKKVFYTFQDAQAYKPEFIKLCTTPQTMYDMRYLVNDETLDVEIGLLELCINV